MSTLLNLFNVHVIHFESKQSLWSLKLVMHFKRKLEIKPGGGTERNFFPLGKKSVFPLVCLDITFAVHNFIYISYH